MKRSLNLAHIPEAVIPGLSRDLALPHPRLVKFFLRFARRIPAQGRDDSQWMWHAIASLKNPLRLFAPLVAVFALTGCILVDDFSPKWESGVTDSCTSKIAESLYLTEFRRDPEGKDMEKLAREFSLGDQHFLMLKQDANDKGGRMYHFRVTNGIFQRFRLDPVMRKAFEKDYPNAPVSLAHDTVQVKNLNDDVTKVLAEVASKPDYWEIDDQTLYNVVRNPLCKFEDRDLKALEEKDKPQPLKPHYTDKSKKK